ncbi:MAG TPA: Ig-like domain-containing protein [Gemmatimonadales bacterium]|nr:Ig-like domain-containing protein [Gemmatimonadales bacterium]
MILPRFRLPVVLAALLLAPALPLHAQGAVEVQVTPARLRLKVAQRERLFLSAYDAAGNLLTDPAYAFAPSKAGVVRVEKDGTVIGVAPGTTQLEIRSGTGKASVSITVTGAAPPAPAPAPEPAPVLPAGARLVPTPDSLRLLRLEAARIGVALVTPEGTGLGQVHVTWASSAPAVARVDSDGAVQALQPGRTQLTATGPGGLTASVIVDVTDDSLTVRPDRLLLGVDAIDSVRVTVPAQGDRPLTAGLAWRSSDPAVARVSGEGVVVGAAPGEAYLLVSGFGRQHTIRVTVHPRAARLRMSPAPGTPIRLTPGGTALIVLQALTADSVPIGELDYRWAVGDTTVAAFDPVSRQLTAHGIGRTTLTLTTREFDPAVWEVEVVAGGVVFARPRLRLGLGARDTLAATLLDPGGHPIGPAGGLSFASDQPEVVAVDLEGVVQAVALGSARISGRTPWGTTAEAEVYVTEGLLLGMRKGDAADLVQVAADGSGTPLPIVADGALNLQGRWSPDGTRIAFTAVHGGNIDIYVVDADGRNLKRLTDAPESDSEPAWSPDGGTIVFTSLRSGAYQVWAMNADGTGVRALTDGPGANTEPAFRPDGRMIAFISTRDGNADLFEMGNEGADPRAITRTDEPESHPAYFPNGDLAVAVERSGRSDILRIRAGDGQRIMLQSMPGKVGALALSRDGATLAFALSVPGADRKTPVNTFQLKSLAPDRPPRVVPLPGEVLSASFQGSR